MNNNKHANNDRVKMEHAFQHNIYVKKMLFEQQGTVYCGHHHSYDHITLVSSGKVRVRFGPVPEAFLPPEEKEYAATSMFITRSFREHEIMSLEDNTVVCCIHAIRQEDGQIIDPPSELSGQTITSFDQLSQLLGNQKSGKIAFDPTTAEKFEMLERALEEGTLVADSGDKLI